MSSVSGGSSEVSGKFSSVLPMFPGVGSMFDFSGFSAMYDLEICLRTPFLRVLSSLNDSDEECLNCRRIFSVIPAQEGLICPIRHTGGPSLLLLSLMSTRSFVSVLFGIFFPCSPWLSGGLRSSWNEYFAIVSGVPGSFYQTSVLVVPWQRRFQRYAYLLSNGILSIAVFTHFMWGGEDKNKGNRRIC